jgi:hypothetical protein
LDLGARFEPVYHPTRVMLGLVPQFIRSCRMICSITSIVAHPNTRRKCTVKQPATRSARKSVWHERCLTLRRG